MLLLSEFPNNCLIMISGSTDLFVESASMHGNDPQLCEDCSALRSAYSQTQTRHLTSVLPHTDHSLFALDNIQRNYKQIIYYMIIILKR